MSFRNYPYIMFSKEELIERASMEYINSHYDDSEFRLFLECVFQEEDAELEYIYVPEVHLGLNYCYEIHNWLMNECKKYPECEFVSISETPYAVQYESIKDSITDNSEIDMLEFPCNGLLLGTLLMFITVYREQFSDNEAWNASIVSVEEIFKTPYKTLMKLQKDMIERFPDVIQLFQCIEDECANNTNIVSFRDGLEECFNLQIRGNPDEITSL